LPLFLEVRAHNREEACARNPVQLSPGILPRRVTVIHATACTSWTRHPLPEPEP